MPVIPIAPKPATPINAAPAGNLVTQLIDPNATPAVVGTNDGTVITAPTVEAPRLPAITGESLLDRGADALYEVLHARVGRHPQGSRIGAADLPDGCDIARLVRLGAILVLEAVSPTAAEIVATVTKPKK